MSHVSVAYDELNKHWKSSCKVVLGDEVGELADYAEWLYEANGPREAAKSSLSGKEVIFADQKYPKEAPKISFDEVDLGKKYPPLSINDIKDIDSIISAVSERVLYAGNIVLGNSKFVEESTTITECFYAYHSERVAFSKYVAYTSRGGYSEHVFGCYGAGPVQFAIKGGEIWDVQRSLCASKVNFSSDIYFSHGLMNCHDCMFSFNSKAKRQAIGNLELAKDSYQKLKPKLLAEIREKLEKDRRLPSIFELAASAKPDYSGLKKASVRGDKAREERPDKSRIEKAFSDTCQVVLGRPLSQVDKYGKWMASKSSIETQSAKSCLSGKPILVPKYAYFHLFPKDRLLSQVEADLAGEKLSLGQEEAAILTLANAPSILSRIAFFTPEINVGNSRNNIKSPLNIDSADCYDGILYLLSKCCAFCFSPRSCEYSFGCREPRESSFCINCHYSTRISRCFECDSCGNCTGCYFCHNCENVHDSMFCFNVKNKRYAIGNAEVGREKFLGAKKMLLGYVGKELEAKGALKLDIYNLAEFKGKKSAR